jgi:hypothetical protein
MRTPEESSSNRNELTEYSKINDDEYPHALRVYQDLETGAVRLQSSIMEGGMSR